MSIHAFSIENYRLFKEFRLEQAARVNLIVGTNNSGKSSLLEAIYLLTGEKPGSSLLYILSERGEYVYKPADPRSVEHVTGGYVVSHIFHGHQWYNNSTVRITGEADTVSSLRIAIENGYPHPKKDEREEGIRSVGLTFEQITAGERTFHDRLPLSDGCISFRHFPRQISPPEQSSRLVTTEYLSYDVLSALWDSITLTPLEEKVIEALRIIEPDIERISFMSRQNSNNGILFKFQQTDEPIPLSSMGDGMRRILGIIVSLVSVGTGVLLIDEIDTGLYYQVLKEMWRLIFETAIKGHSQVFATTHSWDCVRAFQEAIHHVADKHVGRLIRLERTEERIEAVGYSPDELDIAIEQGIEVR